MEVDSCVCLSEVVGVAVWLRVLNDFELRNIVFCFLINMLVVPSDAAPLCAGHQYHCHVDPCRKPLVGRFVSSFISRSGALFQHAYLAILDEVPADL
jgi:hypothetical protein